MSVLRSGTAIPQVATKRVFLTTSGENLTFGTRSLCRFRTEKRTGGSRPRPGRSRDQRGMAAYRRRRRSTERHLPGSVALNSGKPT
jgi:hypothetical protein